MIVLRREWLSERAGEAILFIGTQNVECAAFSHPCSIDSGSVLSEPLLAITVKDLVKAESGSDCQIARDGESLAHTVVAKVIDRDAGIVEVGPIKIDLDEPLPGDIEEGEMVSFRVNRIDAIE